MPRQFFEDSKLATYWMGLEMDERNQIFNHLSNVIVPDSIKHANRKNMPSGSSVGECSNFDRINEQDAEEEDSEELSVGDIKRFHRKDRDLLESSEEDNNNLGDYFAKRRTQQIR